MYGDDTLRSIDFTPTVSDPRLYVKFNGDGTKIYNAVHVDDFGIAARNKSPIEEVVAQIKVIYQCVDGDLDFYLGMQVARDRVKRTITISQLGY